MDILERIDHWGRIAPHRIAHLSGGRSLTFGDLKSRSDDLAAHLAATLDDDGSPVAVLGHKEPEMLISFIGCVKSGHPYVPIDKSLPSQRVEQIVTLSKSKVTLTPDSIANIGSSKESRVPRRIRTDDPYYIIFTSGSTGQPKGVIITLGCLHFFLEWMLNEHNFITQNEVFLNQAPFSFDLSVMDLYLSLATGGTLFSLTNKEIGEPQRLIQSLASSNTTVWVSTPSFAQLCLEQETFSASLLPRLRRFIFCGETLPHWLAKELIARFPNTELWNTYGPTEATVAITSVQIDGDILDRFDPLPIGSAPPGALIIVSDEEGQSVVSGDSGEIVIVAPSVSSGYLHRPDLTDQKFFLYRGCKAYRTGDRGHFQDGLFFFERRMDGQIKLRGYRIEPGDVETNLRALPEVRDAVVVPVLKENVPDYLAAYVVLANNGGKDSDTDDFHSLKYGLAERIPPYMIPSVFIRIKSIPLTVNGKIDRHSLPPAIPAERTIRKMRAANSSLELELQSIWKKLFGMEAIGVDDNFFELGGQSLLAARMFAEIRIRCGKNLPLATLLQAPTIETLALVLKGNETADWSSLVPINPDGSRLPFFCVHGAGGNILNLLLLARYLDPDQPVYAFQSSGLDGKQAPIATVEEMAEHYLSEMRRVRPNGPYLLGGLSFGGLIAFEMAQQLCSQGQEVRLLALLDTHGAGYPAPLWRRLPDHVAHLRRLGCVEYFICFRAQYDRFSRRLGRKIRQLAYELAEGLGCRLTDTLQKIEMTNRRAQDCYTLQLYPGRIVLFRVEEQMVGGDPQLGWGQIASDRLDILDTPGDHATFIEEPLVKTLAEKLTTILLKSQCSADKDL